MSKVLRRRSTGRKRASAFGWECSMRDIEPTFANGRLRRDGCRDVDVFVRNVTRKSDVYGATVRYEIRTDAGKKMWSHEERIAWTQRRRKTPSLVQLEAEHGSGAIADMVVGALGDEGCAEMEDVARIDAREGRRADDGRMRRRGRRHHAETRLSDVVLTKMRRMNGDVYAVGYVKLTGKDFIASVDGRSFNVAIYPDRFDVPFDDVSEMLGYERGTSLSIYNDDAVRCAVALCIGGTAHAGTRTARNPRRSMGVSSAAEEKAIVLYGAGDGSYTCQDGNRTIRVYYDGSWQWCWEETADDAYVGGEAGFPGLGSCIKDIEREKGRPVHMSRMGCRTTNGRTRNIGRACQRRSSRMTRHIASHDEFDFYDDGAYMCWYGDDGVVVCNAEINGDGPVWTAKYYLMDPLDDFESTMALIGTVKFTPDESLDADIEEDVREHLENGCPVVDYALMEEFNIRTFAKDVMDGGGIRTRKDVVDAYRRMYQNEPSQEFIDGAVELINGNYAVHIESKTDMKRNAMRSNMKRKSADVKPDGYVLVFRDRSIGVPRLVKNLGQLDALLMDFDNGDEDRLTRLLMLEDDVDRTGYGECSDPDLVAYAVSGDWSKIVQSASRRNARRNATRDGIKTSRMDKDDIVRDLADHCWLTIDDVSDVDDRFEDEVKRNDAILELSDVFSASFHDDPELLMESIMAYDEGIIGDVARAIAKDVVDRIRSDRRNAGHVAKRHRNARASMRKHAWLRNIPREFGGGWIETDELEPGKWRARGVQCGEYATKAVYGRTEQDAVRKAVKEMQRYPDARNLTLGDVMGVAACRSASRCNASTRKQAAVNRGNKVKPAVKSARARRIAAYGRNGRR